MNSRTKIEPSLLHFREKNDTKKKKKTLPNNLRELYTIMKSNFLWLFVAYVLLDCAHGALLHLPIAARKRSVLGGVHGGSRRFSGALTGQLAAGARSLPLKNDLPHGSASYYGEVQLGTPPQTLQVRKRRACAPSPSSVSRLTTVVFSSISIVR